MTDSSSGDPLVPAGPIAPPVLPSPPAPRWLVYGAAAVALVSLGVGLSVWQRLNATQEQLARQSADSGATAVEARTLARQAQELSRDTAARQAVTDTRVSDLSQQRSQLDELMQSLSRARDENVIVDIEAGLRLAQQQSQLTLSPEPLLTALRAADQRLARGSQPRLARVRAAVARDIERIKSATYADVPGMLVRIDELVRQVDDLPVANAVGVDGAADRAAQSRPSAPQWWQRALGNVRDELRGLVRVHRIDQPEAMLLSPGQSFFLRENVKLKLLNARLSLLARQTELARADLAAAQNAIGRYFESGRRTQSASAAVAQLIGQLRSVEMPRIDETLALLDATAAGR